MVAALQLIADKAGMSLYALASAVITKFIKRRSRGT